MNVSVILGSHVNAYGIASELRRFRAGKIFCLSETRSVLSYSNMLDGFSAFAGDDELCARLNELASSAEKLVVFATSDDHVNSLDRLRKRLATNIVIPFREDTSVLQDKVLQYEACKRLGVPCPEYGILSKATGIEPARHLRFPIIIKPTGRVDLTNRNVPRNVIVNAQEELSRCWQKLKPALDADVIFLACEIVPGPSSNIYAYVAHRSASRGIVNEWCGRKLSQAPNDYGVFSSASNERVVEVLDHGRRLVDGMDLTGFCQPEFKFDARDRAYKLMEINLRSMMWSRVGTLTGVPLHYSQFLEACGQDVPKYDQNEERVYLINPVSELVNLLTRRRYFGEYLRPILGAKCRKYLLCLNWSDPIPFLVLLSNVPRAILARWRHGLS